VPAPDADRHSELQWLSHRARSVGASSRYGQAHSQLVSRAVGRARLGDRQALGFLYARYAEDVYGCALDIARDRDLAERATGQVFAALPSAIDAYEEREAPFSAWLLTVARGVAEDHVRTAHPSPAENVERSGPLRRGADVADYPPAGGGRNSAGSRRAMRWLSRSAR
jgi:DNA-directed RNA polymerase specialized sigma24 family protein